MTDTLTTADYARLCLLQHERLRSHFPAELQDTTLMTRADATLIISCDWETISLLNDDWDVFGLVAYVFTGCDRVQFFVDDALVMTQARAIELQQSVNHEASPMVTATAQRKQAKAVSNFTQAAAAVIDTTPQRPIAEIVRELADAIAYAAIARVEASAPIVNGHIAASHPAPAVMSAAEPETPTKLPKVRLQGIFTPTRSNWTQAAKRYLKAVDPNGDATKALTEIVNSTPTGQAHIERALREYPAAEREATRPKLYNGFLKIAAERRMAEAPDAE